MKRATHGPWWTSALLGMLVLSSVVGCYAAAGDDPSDTFDDAGSLKSWQILKPNPREDSYLSLDIGKSRKGWLTISPRPGNTWYNEGMGPMLYKELEGDFLVETRVATHSKGGPKADPPRAHYNSAGLIVRDPASGPRKQNWVVVNVGRQDPQTGTEIKTTVDSRSHLELQRGPHAGQLRLARIGSTIYGLRKLDGEDKWTQVGSFERKDLPKRVQVGLMCNGWTDGADLEAEIDYVQFSVPKAVGDLTAESRK